MIDIAFEGSEGGVYQKDIAERQNISLKYLDNIIASLKTAGLITTVRGKKSGYRITRRPDQIRILDIYKAFEPEIAIVECMSHNFACERSDTCGAKEFWEGLNESIVSYFQSYSLEDLMQIQKRKQAAVIKN